jgi:hypothetical protein
LDYEDLLRGRRESLRRVLDFLKVRPVNLDGATLKHTNDDLRQAVVNFEDLRRLYAGTRYAPMFDEGLAPGA